MSKICGLVDPTATNHDIQERLQAMAHAMSHNPNSPKECLLFEGGGIALVGNNPSLPQEERRWAHNEQHGSLLGMCGHVVGFEEAAALLQAFNERGEELLGELNGTFAFAHYDPEEHSLTVANDRYGFMPLYYCCKEGAFLFASEVKAILRVLGPQDLDWHSVCDFFYIGHMMGQETLFEGIYAMDSGQLMTYRQGRLRKRQYHDFTKMPLLSPEEVSTEKLATLFVEAVRRRVREEEPSTLLLSGGFDSRLILGAMHELGISPRIVTLEHADESQGADGRFARLMAERLGLECDFRPSREGFFFSEESLKVFYVLDGMVPTWGDDGKGLFISEVYPELDSGMGAVWDGLGIDAVLAGGRHGFQGPTRRRFKGFTERRGGNSLLLGLILSPRWFLAANRGFMSRLQGELDKILPSENQFRYFVLEHRLRRRIAVNPHQLFSVKVEPVTPGADMDFMDYALKIPRSLTLNRGLYIEMLRKHFPVLTEVPAFSSNALFRFEREGWKREHAQEAPTAPNSSLLKRWSRRASKVLGAVGVPNYRTRTQEHESAGLVIRILQEKHFERPFYNKRLLRRMFASYRRGNGVYHKLFTFVFYIELWHLLFVDEDSPLLFDPRNL